MRSISVIDDRRMRATVVGASAIVLWSFNATLITLTGGVPPLQLAAMTFAAVLPLTAGVWWWRRDWPGPRLRLPWHVYAVGIGGFFGNIAMFYTALRHAPAAEASLINYLWPMMMVLLGALLPGEHLRFVHVLGALCAIAGMVILFGVQGLHFHAEYWFGYTMALGSAVTWAGYSLFISRHAHVSLDAVAMFCGGTALLALAAHLLLEKTVWPATAGPWLVVTVLAIGPVLLAYFAWDHGVKHGHVRMLGALSCATPLLSTLWLVLVGLTAARWSLAAACMLLTLGMLLCSAPTLGLSRLRVSNRSEDAAAKKEIFT